MKIYEQKVAPNARRVRIFLAEKGVLEQVEFEELDLARGDNLTPEYKAKNPIAKVPALEFEDGTIISESVAICRYFEAQYPEPPLMGVTAMEQANIEMWQRQTELYFFNMIGLGFQHTSGFFSDRMTPFADYGAECIKNALKFMRFLNRRLSEQDYIASDTFTIADITALCAIDFAKVLKIRIADDLEHLKRWYDLLNQRPSIKV